MEDMVDEVEKKLAEKRTKYQRPDNMDDFTYEQLLDEKTAVQKALLHIEGAFGRPVSKEDRTVVRPLYDRYRTLKRLLIRAGAVSFHFSYFKVRKKCFVYVYSFIINSAGQEQRQFV